MLQPDSPRPIVLIAGEPDFNPVILRRAFDVRRYSPQTPVDRGAAAIVLDFRRNGAAAIEATRARNPAPLLAILARNVLPACRIEALEAGADDVLSVPYEDAELVARVRALIRRGPPLRPSAEDSGLQIDLARQRVRRHGCEIAVTPTEIDLLTALARRPGAVVSPARLNAAVDGALRPMSAAALYTTISALRQKLHAAGLPSAIRTVRCRGYALADDVAAEIRY